jgi:hypothetical protein
MKTLSQLTLVLIVFAAMVGVSFGDWSGAGGATGEITIYSANSEDGALASIGGFYAVGGSWVNATFGTGNFNGGYATVTYTIPTACTGAVYWNTYAYLTGSSGVKSQYTKVGGAWDQFFTTDPNNTSVTQSVYSFSNFSVTNTSASLCVSAKSGTVFPSSASTGYVDVYKAWTGTLSAFMDSSSSANSYYSNQKFGVLPTYLTNLGYTISVLQYSGANADAINQFQKIRISKGAYSTDVFAYKNLSNNDASGYVYWVSLVDAATATATSHDLATGTYNFSNLSLATDTTYFIMPEVKENDTVGGQSWIQGLSSSDLIVSGVSVVPEPGTLALLGAAVLGLLAYVWKKNK